MADRILTFSAKRCDGDPTVMLPAYYIETDLSPVAVRIYAVDAPDVTEAEFEIYDDGVSIMNDKSFSLETYQANTSTYSGTHEIFLGKGENSEEMAEDFNDNVMEHGSWITCVMKKDGGGKNFTVILELAKVSESGEDEE